MLISLEYFKSNELESLFQVHRKWTKSHSTLKIIQSIWVLHFLIPQKIFSAKKMDKRNLFTIFHKINLKYVLPLIIQPLPAWIFYTLFYSSFVTYSSYFSCYSACTFPLRRMTEWMDAWIRWWVRRKDKEKEKKT